MASFSLDFVGPASEVLPFLGCFVTSSEVWLIASSETDCCASSEAAVKNASSES